MDGWMDELDEWMDGWMDGFNVSRSCAKSQHGGV